VRSYFGSRTLLFRSNLLAVIIVAPPLAGGITAHRLPWMKLG
jgi:hypothetical protein